MLEIALKEWSVICDLLLEGRMTLLLRKGGIHESGGPGVFKVEYPRFVMFPSWAHQKPQMLKPPYCDRVEVLDEPEKITFRGIGEVADIWQVTDRSLFQWGGELANLHPWSSQQIHMRFDYKSERPLYLMAVRIFLLHDPKIVFNHAVYTGCRSWVPLRTGDGVIDTCATPVLRESNFKSILETVRGTLGTS